MVLQKFDILLSESPDKSETQDELELQSYLLDKSDLKNPHSSSGPIEKPNIHDYQLLQNEQEQN